MAKERGQKEPKIAYIESIVTDQGNGGSYCSNCDQDLTNLCREQTNILIELTSQKAIREGRIPELEKKLEKSYICPGCKYNLKDGGTYINSGGSDF